MSPVPVVGAAGTPLLWYLARGAGIAALVLLTLSVVGGVLTSVRWSSARWPRFVIQLLHRNASLLALVAIGVHIAAVVIDGFAPIGWKDAVLPFAAGYRSLWLGFGAIAFDLVLVLIVTSLLRHRIGQRTWRWLHWTSYAAWALVVVHGFGAGSDAQSGVVLIANAVCVALVVLAVWWRLAQGWPERAGARLAGLGVSLLAPLLLFAWLTGGPLAAGWARKAGTPDSLLGAAGSSASVSTAAPGSATSSPTTAAPALAQLPRPPFQARIDGALTRSAPDTHGFVTIRLDLQLSGGATGVLEIVLQGQPVGDAGVQMSASRVRLGTADNPGVYDGQVTALDGNVIGATLHASGASPLRIVTSVQIDAANHVTGDLRASASGSATGEGGGSR